MFWIEDSSNFSSIGGLEAQYKYFIYVQYMSSGWAKDESWEDFKPT